MLCSVLMSCHIRIIRYRMGFSLCAASAHSATAFPEGEFCHVDAMLRQCPLHEVFHVPFGISVLTFQLTIRRFAILYFHASNIELCPPMVSPSQLLNLAPFH